MRLRLVALAVFLMPYGRAFADSISSNTWYEFAYDSVGVAAVGCAPTPSTGACVPNYFGDSVFAPSAPWTFVAPPGGAEFLITDAFQYGDSFNVFDFGSLILSTPTVSPMFGTCGSDPNTCFADPNSSSGMVALGAGTHSITIVPTAVVEIGAGYFETEATVPEPSSGALALLASGWVGVLAFCRRRNAAVSK